MDFVEWCFVMLCECSKCDVYVVIGGCVVCCECGVCCLVCWCGWCIGVLCEIVDVMCEVFCECDVEIGWFG